MKIHLASSVILKNGKKIFVTKRKTKSEYYGLNEEQKETLFKTTQVQTVLSDSILTKERIKSAIVKTWNYIRADAGATSVGEAVQLSLDASRPVSCGALTQEEYSVLMKIDHHFVDQLGRDALRGNL